MKVYKYWIQIILLLLVLVGCTTNEPFRKNLPDPSGQSAQRPSNAKAIDPTNAFAIETNANYKLGFVEFDDQGWFWAHKQWKAVKDAIETEASNNDYGLVIVAFVHGWKNNAAYDNANVEMCRGVLNSLNEAISREDTNTSKPRKVFGVYLGWRGLSASSDYFPFLAKEASFYNRKNVAERIGHQGAATQVFTELELMQEDFNKHRTNSPQTKLIIIGHSFGGALVFSAISQILTEHLVLASRHKGMAPVRSLGDLVVLLNPAFEASLYENVIALATSPDIEYPQNQRPVLAIFTSQTDTATKDAFPLGRHIATWFEKTRRQNDPWLFNIPKDQTPNQRSAILQTIGNDEDFLTYDLKYTNYQGPVPPSSTNAAAPYEPPSNMHALQTSWTTNSFQDVTNMASYTFPNLSGTNRYACILVPRPHAKYAHKPGNPFLNVSVDKRIMNGHNDITNPVLVKFLEDFLVFSQTNYPATILK